ncbi:MAG: cation diffusion facilitator family transporter, partial [Bacilli bacterium]|nr:cation diffusion facilitator family transporter [Bacilli bacterium]
MFKILIKLFIKDYQNTDNPLVRNKYGILSGVVGITSNFLLAITKMITGFLIGSIAIVADGINNLMDGASSIITVIAFRLSILPPDREHPYGHQRIEYIGGLIVSILITVVGGILAQTSLDKILHPQPINIEKFSIIVIILSASILLKLWQSLFYRKAGKKIKSIALIATSQDSLNDCL